MSLGKLSSWRTLLLLTFIGLAVIYYFALGAGRNNSVQPTQNTGAVAKSEQTGTGLPVRLKIPSINVSAAIEYMDLTSQGEMAAPKDPANAGWYSLGPRPGEIGSAVIDGHFGYRNHIPAVFDNLSQLRAGDKLYIEDKKGTAATFLVRESRNYDPKADATGVFHSSDGKSHLNLITCEGTWNASQKSFSNRLVVFTDRVL